MATLLDVTFVELIVGYSFPSPKCLVRALTAAGAEEHNHDGNRKFARLGKYLARIYTELFFVFLSTALGL